MFNWQALLRKIKPALMPLLIGLGVLTAAIIAGLLIYARIYLTPDVIGSTVRGAMESQLRRQVSFRAIEVGPLKGIVLRGMTVHKAYPWEKQDFFTCDEISLSFSYAPLLFKKLVVRSLALKKPVINFQPSRHGSANIYGTVKPSAGTDGVFELLVLPSSFLVNGGTVRWVDPAADVDLELTNVQVDAGNISVIMPFDVAASAGIAGSGTPDIQLKGNCFIPGKKLKAELSIPEVDFSRFSSYLAELDIPLRKGKAALNLALEASGSKSVQISCKAGLRDAAVVLVPAQKADDEIGFDGLVAELDIQAEYNYFTDSVSIKKIQGKLLSSPFTGSGTAEVGGRPADMMYVTVSADKLSLDELSSKLYYGAASPFKGLRLGGLLGVRMDFEGKLDSALFPAITVDFFGSRILYPPLGSFQPELNGNLTLNKRVMSLSNLRFGTPNLNIVLAGDILDYLQWSASPKLRIVSSTLNMVEFFENPSKVSGEDIGPFDFGPMKFTGPIELGDFGLASTEFSGVQGSYLFENSRFSIKNFNGIINETGSFNISTNLDLKTKGFEYSLDLSLADVAVKDLDDMLLLGLSRFVDGTISGSVFMSGRGTKPATIVESFSGNASFSLKNGRFKEFVLPEQLGRFIRDDALRSLSFNRADMQLHLRRGRIDTQGTFLSPKVELYPSGEIGLNGQINMLAQLRLSPDVFSRDIRIAEYLPHEGSWIALPLVIKGTIDNPSVALTDEALRQILQEALPKMFMDMMRENQQESPGDSDNTDDRPL